MEIYSASDKLKEIHNPVVVFALLIFAINLSADAIDCYI